MQAGRSVLDKVQAVFAYGTLRGDWGATGDRWGVIRDTNAAWCRASVKGFSLYQRSDLFYPFAVQTENPDNVIHGTLLVWPDAETARRAIKMCDQIEGFDENLPLEGLYRRAVVEVAVPAEAMKLACERGLLESHAQPSELSHFRSEGGREQGTPKLSAYIYHQEMPQLDSGAMLLSFPHGDWLHQRAS
eukprot:TRINITY_DN44900_c0_g1_i1.p1 TRINITY_DN44900_c0_g1~~TRINITY_DN44900_c0_g1_i1.p1  ORF type:complete len:210 (-),score=25.28 TRINITY_DN44900_c0_g1_i1:172-738(-)